MGQIVLQNLEAEKASSQHKHYLSFLFVIEGRFYELKGKFFTHYPMSPMARIRAELAWRYDRRKKPLKQVVNERAKRTMSTFAPYMQRYVYQGTLTRVGSKVSRHVVMVRMNHRDLDRLINEDMLREIDVDANASAVDQVRTAMFGLQAYQSAHSADQAAA